VGLGLTYMMFNGNARKIRDLLAQSCEPVEKSGFTRVGRPNDGNHVRLHRRLCQDAAGASLAIVASTHFGWLGPFRNIRRGNVHARCGFPAQCHFRSIHSINTRLPARGAACGHNRMPRQESKFHKPQGDVFRQVKTLQPRRNAEPQFIEGRGLRRRLGEPLLDTELHYGFSMTGPTRRSQETMRSKRS
jgi:hypothetical protein